MADEVAAPAEKTDVAEAPAQETQAEGAEAIQTASPAPPELTDDKPGNEDEAALQKTADELLGNTEETTEETTEEVTEESAEGEASKEGLLATATELFPDKEINSEEDAIKAVTEFVNESREYKEKQQEATKKLAELFRGNPDLVDLIHLMNEGATMTEALPYITGEADESGLDGAKDGWQKTAAEKRAAKTEQEKSLQEVSKNLEVSVNNIKQFAEENKMSDEEAGEFLTMVDEVFENYSKGNITNDILTKLLKGMRHDKVVKDEVEKAEIAGRNEGIKEVTTKKAAQKGDGLPHPKSTATEKGDKAQEPDSPDDFIARNIDSINNSRKF